MATAQNNNDKSLESAIQQQKAGADEIQTKIAKLLEANRQLAEAREIEDQLKTFKQNNPYSKTFMEHVRSIPKIKYLFVPTAQQKIDKTIEANNAVLNSIDQTLIQMGTKSSVLQGAIKTNILQGAGRLEKKLSERGTLDSLEDIKQKHPNLKISEKEWKDIINNTYNKELHYNTADDVNKLLFKNYGLDRPNNLPKDFNDASAVILSQQSAMTTKGYTEITDLLSQNMILREMQVKMNLLIKDNNNIPELVKLENNLNIDKNKLSKSFGEHLKDTWGSIKHVFKDSKTQKLQKDAIKNSKIIDGIDKDLDKALQNIEKSVNRRQDKLDKALYEIADRHNYDSKQRQEIGALVSNLEPLIKELDKKFENAIDKVGKVIENTPPQLVTVEKESLLISNPKVPTFPPPPIPTEGNYKTSLTKRPSEENIYAEISDNSIYLEPRSALKPNITSKSSKEPIYQSVDPITKQQIIESSTGEVSPEQKIAAKSPAPVAAAEVAAPPPAPSEPVKSNITSKSSKEPIYQNVNPITKLQIIESSTGEVSPEQKIAAKSPTPVAAVEAAAPPPPPPIEGLTGVGKQNVPPPPAPSEPVKSNEQDSITNLLADLKTDNPLGRLKVNKSPPPEADVVLDAPAAATPRLQPQDTGKSPQNEGRGDFVKQIQEAGNVKLKTKEERDKLLEEQAKKIGENIPKLTVQEQLKAELEKRRKFIDDNSRRNSTSSVKSSWGKE